MAGRECYHCKQWIEAGEAHDCWTTTEQALTRDLSDDLQEAWERLRETAAAFGEQRIYASHNSIMFARKSCYFFVRPKKTLLEVCVFLGRALKAPQVRRVDRTSKSKVAHIVHVRHRDEVEAPLTTWLQEAYDDLLEPKSAGREEEELIASIRCATADRSPAVTTTRGRRRRAGALADRSCSSASSRSRPCPLSPDPCRPSSARAPSG